MNGVIKWPRIQTWLAAAVGLLAGVMCQRAFETPDSGAKAGRSNPPAGADPSAELSHAKTTGPTTVLLREVSTFSAEKCEELIRGYFESGERGHEIEMEAIFRRWMTLESPDKVLERLSDLEVNWRRDFAAACFRAWVAVDEKSAMADKKQTQFSLARLLHVMDLGDPSFIDRLSIAESGLLDDEPVRKALALLGSEYPDLAKSIADSKLREDLKSKYIQEVARGWATRDPRAALAWLQSLGLTGEPLAAVISEWMKKDPDAARQAWETAGKPGAEPGADVPTAALADSHSPRNQLSLALHRDPFLDVAALHRALSEADIDWSKPDFFSPAINQDGWYAADPAAAARQAEQLPPGKARDYIMNVICSNWAAEDLEAASSFADRNGIKSRYLDVLQEAPGEEMRQAALAAPEQTFSALFDPETFSGAGNKSGQLYQLAKEWSERDPEAVANWLIGHELPTDNSSPGWSEIGLLFSNTLGYTWARVDPVGASQWVDSLPDGPLRAKAWSAMNERVAKYSPDYAFSLTSAWIEDPARRMSALTSDLKAVAKEIGQPAALELLKSPHLSAEESAALSEALRADPGNPSR